MGRTLPLRCPPEAEGLGDTGGGVAGEVPGSERRAEAGAGRDGEAACPPEKSRTFSERESKFTVKFFTLQFFAHFSSLVYIAFILGR